MDAEEKIQRLEILYQSKAELEGIVERAKDGKAEFFAQQLEAVKQEIKRLQQ